MIAHKLEKDYALLLSFVGQARLQFAGLHSLFLALWCIVIEIGGVMRDFLFWYLMYLHYFDIRRCRCSFGSCCICNPLIFAVADALLEANVSALPWYSPLQMLFFRLMYLQLAFLWTYRCFLHCLSCTIASTSCLFYDLRMLPAEILHPQPVLSITCRYSPQKFCILNLLFPCPADTSHRNLASSIPKNPLSQISSFNILWALFTPWPEPIHSLQKNWYKKFERIWSERWRHLERKFLC